MLDIVNVDGHNGPRFGADNARSFPEKLGLPYPILDSSCLARVFGCLAESCLLPPNTAKDEKSFVAK